MVVMEYFNQKKTVFSFWEISCYFGYMLYYRSRIKFTKGDPSLFSSANYLKVLLKKTYTSLRMCPGSFKVYFKI